jgi:hypothetical protein
MIEQLAAMFGTTVEVTVEADSIDESHESTYLLAREAARAALDEDVPRYITETPDGFIVAGDRQAIFMGHNGAFELADIPQSSSVDDDEIEDDDEIDLLFADDEEVTVEDIEQHIEAALADIQVTEDVVSALQQFQAAKESGDMDAVREAVKVFEQASGATIRFIPAQPAPPDPKEPVDVGPGEPKSTARAGGGNGKKPGDPGQPSGPKSTGPGTKESRLFAVEPARIQEFIEIARNAGAPDDVSVNIVEGRYEIALPEHVADVVENVWK